MCWFCFKVNKNTYIIPQFTSLYRIYRSLFRRSLLLEYFYRNNIVFHSCDLPNLLLHKSSLLDKGTNIIALQDVESLLQSGDLGIAASLALLVAHSLGLALGLQL